jgi:hypothetical protein
MSYASIASLHGNTPVQAEGSLPGGKCFYFRARGEAWGFDVGATVDDAISAPEWAWSEPWGDRASEAGYMPEETAREIIESCAAMWAKDVAPPTAHSGIPEDEIQASRLARFLREDVVLYHADAFATEGVAGLRGPTAEARAEFEKRVDARLHPILDAVFERLEARARGEAMAEPWLLDVESCRSVGRRWAAMLANRPESMRAMLLEEGARWFVQWTREGKARDALFEEPRRGL